VEVIEYLLAKIKLNYISEKAGGQSNRETNGWPDHCRIIK
jgi:hypothetical protein